MVPFSIQIIQICRFWYRHPSLSRGQVGQVTFNAAAAEIYGAEVEFTYVPSNNWLIEGGLGWLHAELTEVDPLILGFSTGAGSLRPGNKLPDAPEWSITTAVQYDYDLGDGSRLTHRVDLKYTSKLYNNAHNPENTAQGAVALINASVKWTDKNDRWSLIVSGNNLTNQTVLVSGWDNPENSLVEGAYGLPRTWAATVKGKF